MVSSGVPRLWVHWWVSEQKTYFPSRWIPREGPTRSSRRQQWALLLWTARSRISLHSHGGCAMYYADVTGGLLKRSSPGTESVVCTSLGWNSPPRSIHEVWAIGWCMKVGTTSWQNSIKKKEMCKNVMPAFKFRDIWWSCSSHRLQERHWLSCNLWC